MSTLIETTKGTPDCHCHECEPSSLVSLERTRFFPRQLVGPDDLTQDQTYFREKHRRHNRLLHGWGIVCGARVRVPADTTCTVVVEPGYILGPWGDEIVIEREVTVDVCKEGVDGFAACGGGDPWCIDVRKSTADKPLYLAVRHAECPTRPIRVSSCACGCEDSECEYSRMRDGYVFKVLDELPRSHVDDELPDAYRLLTSLFCWPGSKRECPPCPPDPWVVLAQLELEGDEVTPTCDPHRRYAVTFAHYGFRCGAGTGATGLGLLGQKSSALLVDTSTSAGAAPTGTGSAVLNLAGRFAHVPATLVVEEGDTMAEVVERNRDRSYADPATGDAYTFGELVTAAGVPLDTHVSSPLGALAELEGRPIDVPGLRVVRARMETALSPEGVRRLDEEHAGSPEAAAAIPATALARAEATPALRDAVADLTIGDVGGSSREEFIAAVRERTPEAAGAEVEREAERLWEDARSVARLGESWRHR